MMLTMMMLNTREVKNIYMGPVTHPTESVERSESSRATHCTHKAAVILPLLVKVRDVPVQPHEPDASPCGYREGSAPLVRLLNDLNNVGGDLWVAQGAVLDVHNPRDVPQYT
jgi:hypothetical protein